MRTGLRSSRGTWQWEENADGQGDRCAEALTQGGSCRGGGGGFQKGEMTGFHVLCGQASRSMGRRRVLLNTPSMCVRTGTTSSILLRFARP